MKTPTSTFVSLLDHGVSFTEQLRRDVAEGLTATPKSLPPKYFYDARGSALFEEITRLPEYYLTRTETAILADVVDELLAELRPDELVELGSGASRKTRLLLEAMHRTGGRRYRPFDVSEQALCSAARTLTADYPWLVIDGIVGDFEHHLELIPRDGPALVAFLGSTVGNLHPDEQPGFLRRVAATLRPGDAFLLGVDLVKDVATLEAAYDDDAGVTAEFNRNVLRVLNRELDADLPLEAFEHVARYDREHAWIEMALRARRELVATFPSLDLRVHFNAGEEIRTEISCKFTRDRMEDLFRGAGLRLHRWDTDPAAQFALALALPAGDSDGSRESPSRMREAGYPSGGADSVPRPAGA